MRRQTWRKPGCCSAAPFLLIYSFCYFNGYAALGTQFSQYRQCRKIYNFVMLLLFYAYQTSSFERYKRSRHKPDTLHLSMSHFFVMPFGNIKNCKVIARAIPSLLPFVIQLFSGRTDFAGLYTLLLSAPPL